MTQIHKDTTGRAPVAIAPTEMLDEVSHQVQQWDYANERWMNLGHETSEQNAGKLQENQNKFGRARIVKITKSFEVI